MRELLLRIRALLIGLDGAGRRPLSPAAAVALALMERGDIYAGTDALLPVDEVLRDAPEAGFCAPMLAVGAAYALKRDGQGAAVTAAVRAGEALDGALDCAEAGALPLILLVPCAEAGLEALTARVMARDVPCVQADGRDIMLLLPLLRSALDTAREGDGPTCILCVTDREPEDGTPEGALERLNQVMVLEGFAEREELL